MAISGTIQRIAAITLAATGLIVGVVAPTASAAPSDTDSPIYHSSENWDWLRTPGKLVPGGQFQNDTAGSLCSVGWIVSREKRVFALTAGHCGKPGDIVSVADKYGRTVRVGEFVESRNPYFGGLDDALIEVWDSRFVNASIPFKSKIAGWRNGAWLEQNRPTICRLGYRTGMSCGSYIKQSGAVIEHRNIVDHGDSGGPVFAQADDGKLYAVAVTSFGSSEDATRARSALIEQPMTRWSLTINS